MIVLLLSESFRVWSTHSPDSGQESVTRLDRLKNDIFDGERSFYILLAHTALSLGAFVSAVIVGTEVRWLILRERPHKYSVTDLVRALTVGGCAKLLGLLGLVWQHVAHDPHYALIHGYTMLCLLTAYSGNPKTPSHSSTIDLRFPPRYITCTHFLFVNRTLIYGETIVNNYNMLNNSLQSYARAEGLDP